MNDLGTRETRSKAIARNHPLEKLLRGAGFARARRKFHPVGDDKRYRPADRNDQVFISNYAETRRCTCCKHRGNRRSGVSDRVHRTQCALARCTVDASDRRIKLRSEDARVDWRRRMSRLRERESERERKRRGRFITDKSVTSGHACVTVIDGDRSKLAIAVKVNARSRARIDLSRRTR